VANQLFDSKLSSRDPSTAAHHCDAVIAPGDILFLKDDYRHMYSLAVVSDVCSVLQGTDCLDPLVVWSALPTGTGDSIRIFHDQPKSRCGRDCVQAQGPADKKHSYRHLDTPTEAWPWTLRAFPRRQAALPSMANVEIRAVILERQVSARSSLPASFKIGVTTAKADEKLVLGLPKMGWVEGANTVSLRMDSLRLRAWLRMTSPLQGQPFMDLRTQIRLGPEVLNAFTALDTED
jgi:hypothetical protein